MVSKLKAFFFIFVMTVSSNAFQFVPSSVLLRNHAGTDWSSRKRGRLRSSCTREDGVHIDVVPASMSIAVRAPIADDLLERAMKVKARQSHEYYIDTLRHRSSGTPVISHLDHGGDEHLPPPHVEKADSVPENVNSTRRRAEEHPLGEVHMNTAQTDSLPKATDRNNAERPLVHKRANHRKARGNSPNIFWRAIPMWSLRSHPIYLRLPNAQELDAVNGPQDFTLLRQDSEAWWTTHGGRLTSGSCAAALGFYEEKSAHILGVPSSLCCHKKAVNVYRHLCKGPPAEGYIAAANAALVRDKQTTREARHRKVWQPQRGPSQATRKWARDYTGRPLYPEDDYEDSDPSDWGGSIVRVRMAWGSAQEATALLAILNWFQYKEDPKAVGVGGLFKSAHPRVRLGECGMFSPPPLYIGEGIQSLELGASPDGVLIDTVTSQLQAVVEVKCHAPFHRVSYGGSPGPPPRGRFQVRNRGPSESLGPWHVAQLMLQMHCSGARTAFLLSLSALAGATVFELQRDDAFLEELLHFLGAFVRQFVAPGQPPPHNFFHEDERYRDFLDRTVELAKNAQVVARIPESFIQRAAHGIGAFVDNPL